MLTKAGLRVYSRGECSLRPPRGDFDRQGAITFATIHHGGPVGGPRMTKAHAITTWRGWQAYHQGANGWDDIGYHFGVDGLGRLYAGRPPWAIPAAVGGHNTGSVGIVFMQDGRYHALNIAQRRTLRVLFDRGLPELGVPPLLKLARDPRSSYGVFGHNEFAEHRTNECPGPKIMATLRKERAR